MCDNAWEWARKRNKLRVNEVHGEEEICFVLDDEFLLREERGQRRDVEGTFELEDRSPACAQVYIYVFDCRTLMLICWMMLCL